MTQQYPLQWPQGWKRTKNQKYSNFRTGSGPNSRDVTFQDATPILYRELKLLGATNIVLSSNLQLRIDGVPYSRQNYEDSGVVIYFEYQGNQQSIPCDKWKRAEDNIKAVAKTIEAIRGIERWGAKEMVDAAFKGFQALPDYTTERAPIIPQQDYFSDCEDRYDVRQKYVKIVHTMHPDRGGDTESFKIMKDQYDRRMNK